MLYDVGAVVRLGSFPRKEDPFTGKLAKVVAHTNFSGREAYEIEVIDLDEVVALADLVDDWDDLGKGIVFENEIAGLEPSE